MKIIITRENVRKLLFNFYHTETTLFVTRLWEALKKPDVRTNRVQLTFTLVCGEAQLYIMYVIYNVYGTVFAINNARIMRKTILFKIPGLQWNIGVIFMFFLSASDPQFVDLVSTKWKYYFIPFLNLRMDTECTRNTAAADVDATNTVTQL